MTTQIEETKQLEKKEKSGASHDRFFKDSFSNPKRAKKLLEFILTKKEKQIYDISKLKVEKDSFKEARHADLILSIPFRKNPNLRAKVFILLEHKSHYDKGLFEQVLDYLILLRKWIIGQTGHPELIIPVLFYHGKQAMKWKDSLQEEDFKDFFNKIPVETRKDMLNFNIRIINTKDSRVRKFFKNKGSECWGFIKLLDEIWDIKNPDIERVRYIIKTDFGEELKGATKEEETELVLSLISYLQSAGGLREAIWKTVEKQLIKDKILRGGYMSVVESIKEEARLEGRQEGRLEGIQKGRQEGIQKGIQQVVVNMLKKKADISFISEVTGLPEKEIKEFKNGSYNEEE